MSQMRKLVANGAAINLPAQLFWLLSVTALVPFALLGRNIGEAMIIPLTAHWFQYMGLNYMLTKHKYKDEEGVRQNLPSSAPMQLFWMTCLGLFGLWIIFGLGASFMNANTVAAKIFGGVILGFASIHFWLDAFLWRFREPHVRQSTMPYLIKARQQAESRAS
jgi:hypothetical protein